MVPPCSDRISRVPPYSSLQYCITCTGLSPTEARLSRRFHFSPLKHWPSPRSLATTSGVSVDVLSSGYLDVSVPRVCFYSPMYSGISTFLVITGNPKPYSRTNMTSKFRLSKVGFPIRKSAGQRLFAPHHSLSQRTTSFIASYCQGIHQMPLSRLIALISNAHPSCGYLSDNLDDSAGKQCWKDQKIFKTNPRQHQHSRTVPGEGQNCFLKRGTWRMHANVGKSLLHDVQD